MKPKHKFECPGLLHPLIVKVISQKQMDRYLKDKGTLACYEHDDGIIHVTYELTPKVKEHAFWHEIGHHILDTLELGPGSEVNQTPPNGGRSEEELCDLLGSYLMKLQEAKDHILKELSK